jgi:N-acetylglucosamine transport system substrate-binding protein
MAKDAGTYNGKFLQVNYVMTLYVLYYSASLFRELNLEPPRTYDDLMTLCTTAKEHDKYLFVWGKEAANYYKWMLFDSAIKEAGIEVIEPIANLEPGGWNNETIVAVVKEFEKLIQAGCFKPGGEGTQFTAAQAQWSNDQASLLYHAGSWIENEMKDATKEGFEMTAWPVPTLTDNPKMPFEAIQSGPDEAFVIPSQGANKAGGLELMRAMLSKEAAANFAQTRLAPSIVKDTVPADGFGSTALASEIALLDAAGTNTFNWISGGYDAYYGISADEIVIWNSFLSGQITADEFIAQEEELGARAAADTTVDHVSYDY